MVGAGVSRLVVSKILNHVETGVTAVYDRHRYDREKRAAEPRERIRQLALKRPLFRLSEAVSAGVGSPGLGEGTGVVNLPSSTTQVQADSPADPFSLLIDHLAEIMGVDSLWLRPVQPRRST